MDHDMTSVCLCSRSRSGHIYRKGERQSFGEAAGMTDSSGALRYGVRPGIDVLLLVRELYIVVL